MSPEVRELLECWDEQLLSVWLETQLKGEWQSHASSGIVWPVPPTRPS